ncbi:MAG: hypothetical protein JRI23_18955 [Deltaproteobacteria bacterium]|jgi:chromosome segregation ATPase|nr:hypothetical protein [Deltaproteobacteria bacterium]MBW2533944.1 hypothetical protein [Deltaproteobacteria bacterium]
MRNTTFRHGAAAITLAIAGLVLSGPVGCKAGRISQCNGLITVINEEQGKHKDLKGESPEELKKLADALEATAKKIGEVELEDEKLTAFRDEYKKMAEDLAKSAREAATAGDDREKLEKAIKTMQAIGPREDKLVNDINAFCQGG